MTEAHIYIYGDIYNEQVSNPSEWGIVNLKSVQEQLKAAGNAQKLIVHINSRGGDVSEGFAIHDVLVNSGKKIETIIEGLCASIATIVALAGSERKMLENSEFFIHNPWGMINGDAKDVQKYANELKKAEDRILSFYVSKTRGNRQKISQYMAQETGFTSAEAKKLGFITQVVNTFAARNYQHRMPIAALSTSNSNPNDMSEIKTEIRRTNGVLNSILQKLSIKAGRTGILNMDYTLADGSLVTTDSDEEIAVGQVVTDEASEPLAAGDYELQDGTLFTVAEGGEVTEVTPAQATGTEALRAQNRKLRAEVAAFKKEIAEINNKLAFVAKNIKSGYVPPKDSKTFNKGKQGNDGSLRDKTAARRAELEEKKLKLNK